MYVCGKSIAEHDGKGFFLLFFFHLLLIINKLIINGDEKKMCDIGQWLKHVNGVSEKNDYDDDDPFPLMIN